MKADLFLWRPVVAKLLRWSDYRFMTFEDLLDAHEVLDLKEHYEAEEFKKLGG